MGRFYLSVVILLVSVNASAGGYGWYVYSFDWESFSKELPLIHTAVENSNVSDWDSPSLRRLPANVRALAKKQHAFDEKLKDLILGEEDWGSFSINESPMSFEFYWPKAFHYAFLNSTAKVNSYFRYFESGHPYNAIYETKACEHKWKDEWGYCYDAYFILSPAEVREFEKEVALLRSTQKIPEEYSFFIEHLDGVLKKAASEGIRGLYFEGHE